MILFSTQPLTWGASLAAAVLVPRYLGDAGLGQFAAVTAVAGYVATVACLGVPDYLARRTATHPRESEIDAGGALVLLTMISAILAVGVAIIVALLGLNLPLALLMVALIGTVISTAQSVIMSRLRGQERHRDYAWLNAGSAVLGVIAGIAVLALLLLVFVAVVFVARSASVPLRVGFLPPQRRRPVRAAPGRPKRRSGGGVPRRPARGAARR
jgi:O-antigen/teichoic acid export membrane protein